MAFIAQRKLRVYGRVCTLAVLAACGADARDSRLEQPSSAAAAVLIAAVELQFEDPSPGGQSVWIANRGASEQDLSCWRITGASSGTGAFIRNGTRLSAGRALRFTTPARMLASADTVTLSDRGGVVVSRTPELRDSAGDDQLWYLLPGGSWQFGRNRIPEPATDGQLVSVC